MVHKYVGDGIIDALHFSKSNKREVSGMFYNWRWLHKLLSIALISFGIGLLIATLLEWGWFMVLISLIAMVVGLFILLGEC